MSYVDGIIAAVPNENKQAFIEHAQIMGQVFIEYGAISVVDNWGDDIPDGELTSLPLAVKIQENETVVFSWIVWPSKEARDAGWEKSMQDPRMDEKTNPMPFDGKRLIYGGFQTVFDLAK